MLNSSLLTFTPLTVSMYQSKAHSKFHALLAIVYDNRYVGEDPQGGPVSVVSLVANIRMRHAKIVKLSASSLGTLVFLGFVGSRRLVLVFLLLGFCRLP